MGYQHRCASERCTCWCGGRSFLVKKLSCCTLLQVFQVQISSNVVVYSTEKVVRYQNRPDLRSRSANEIFNAEKKIIQRENSCSQPPSSRINVVCTNDRFIIHPTKKCQKGKIGINFVLPLCLGNTARHLRQLLHPSVEEFNYTRQDRVKRVSS
jgi:hypothetical protein